MKKKTIYTILIILLLGIVLYSYNEFNGNPISSYLAEKKLEFYLTEHYPEYSLRLENKGYNFKFSEYVFEAIQIGSENHVYEFTVRGHIFPEIRYDELRISLRDNELMERVSQQAEEEIFELLASSLDNLVEVSVTVEILKGQYDQQLQWSKEIVFDRPIRLFIILNSENNSREETLAEAQMIQNILNEHGYTYERVMINGNHLGKQTEQKDEKQGYVRYSVSFEPNKNLTLRDIKTYE